MEPIYQLSFDITDLYVDRFGRLKSSSILYFVQEAAGKHWKYIENKTGQNCNLYWVIIRHRVQVSRLPRKGGKVRLETWPMPTTRVAYPRSVVAYDEAGNEVFRSISLWVLMDLNSRNMILPGKSGISVIGTLRGNELAAPASLGPKLLSNRRQRPVCFTDLDRNAHMNNTKYLDWIDDLLPAAYHAQHTPREVTVCYLAEAREGQTLDITWDFLEDGVFQTDIHRPVENKDERIFSARILF